MSLARPRPNARTHARRARCTVALLCLLATSCAPGHADPEVGITLRVTTPSGAANPLLDNKVAFVTMVSERPDVADKDAPRVTIPYAAGAELKLGPPDHTIEFGTSLQVRIELHSQADGSGDAAIGRGLSIPVDLAAGDEAIELFPYVTRPGQFAPAVSDTSKEATPPPLVGAAAVVLGNHNALLIGGAKPDFGVADPLAVANYGDFSDQLVEYDTNLRVIRSKATVPPTYAGTLSKRRAFHTAAAAPGGVVAIAGGYVLLGGVQQLTGSVEFLDPASSTTKESTGAQPHLTHPRAYHQMSHLPIPKNFFVVTGGRGEKVDEKASGTWELWHPKLGTIDLGELQRPRWNHAMVHIEGSDGGSVILIGGQDKKGAVDDIEILRYDSWGNVAKKDSTKVTCVVGGTAYRGGNSNQDCAKRKGSSGYREFSWTPVVVPLPGKVGRTRPGALAVQGLAQTWVVVVGGFEDSKASKPSAAINLYDPQAGTWASHSLKLDVARGALTLAPSRRADGSTEVLILGGVGKGGETVGTVELLTLPGPGASSSPKLRTAAVKAPGGGTLMGVALALPTRHVLVSGGVGVKSGKLTVNGLLRLWAP